MTIFVIYYWYLLSRWNLFKTSSINKTAPDGAEVFTNTDMKDIVNKIYLQWFDQKTNEFSRLTSCMTFS